MKTSIIFLKLMSFCAFLFLVSCEKNEPLQIAGGEIAGNVDRPTHGDPNDQGDDPNGRDNLETGCVIGDWEGSFKTEAINVGFEVQLTTLNAGDCGDWAFIGAGAVVLNHGDIQAAQSGADVDMIIFEPGASEGYRLDGTLNNDCNKMSGTVIRGDVVIGSFELTKI